MNERLRTYLDEQMQAVDDDVRQAIALADGDVHRTLRIALIANAFLHEENATLKMQTSAGFSENGSDAVQARGATSPKARLNKEFVGYSSGLAAWRITLC